MSGRHRLRKDRASADAEGFRRVHRLTPLLRFWSVIFAFLAIFVLNFNLEMLSDIAAYLRGGHWSDIGLGTLAGLGGFIVVCLGIWYVSAIWWRKLGYKLGPDEVALRHGVISSSFRSARYDRIQAVDVVETVIARIFGLAAVRVETAGGTASVIEISFLRKAEAEQLRQEMLAHVHRPAAGNASATVEPDPAGDDLIPEIPVSRTLAAEALRLPTLIALVVMTILVILPFFRAAALPIVVGFVPNIWNLIDTSWRFNSRYDAQDEVLNIAYGLADRRRQTIRRSRIHAVRVTQPLLWRMFGWYEVQVSVAGYGAKAGGKQSGSTRILPVGTRDQALALLELVSDLDAAQIEEFARPEGHTRPTYVSPGRAWLASPVDLRQQAVTLVGTEVAVVHAGRLARRVMVVGTPHIQELTVKAGPLNQLLGVRNINFDLVRGPVAMAGRQLALADAADLLERLRKRQLPSMAQEARMLSPEPGDSADAE